MGIHDIGLRVCFLRKVSWLWNNRQITWIQQPRSECDWCSDELQRVSYITTLQANDILLNNVVNSLLELIVINLGLQAGILSTEVFAMFVVHAMILTFIITPLTALIYPEKCRGLGAESSSSVLDA